MNTDQAELTFPGHENRENSVLFGVILKPEQYLPECFV